ncbi:glutathione S-transferase N-terminal domain-containing protein [Paraburkholderia tropica]|uniref:glutathione S-transferase N-terminal domain-containing protein n=1 Tax=Paraburkholderia tropica TaxID=92647 RepID=UPI002AB5E40A|nr:glutathione S-transferase N-terminal domain-containing protein [Paraburkholderia tropica]
MITAEETLVLYGAAWSVYVRIARLALEEKQVTYDLVEVDVFAKTGGPPEHLNRHSIRQTLGALRILRRFSRFSHLAWLK